jgi:hypothetical protein
LYAGEDLSLPLELLQQAVIDMAAAVGDHRRQQASFGVA